MGAAAQGGDAHLADRDSAHTVRRGRNKEAGEPGRHVVDGIELPRPKQARASGLAIAARHQCDLSRVIKCEAVQCNSLFVEAGLKH